MPTTTSELRLEFFKYIFGEAEGYICIATGDPVNTRKTFRQKFFHWPTQKVDMEDFVEAHSVKRNVWFGINLLDKPERIKEYASTQNVVWADLDACDPKIVEPRPSIVIESSPDRYQAIWKLDQNVPPDIAEDYSRRIAYAYNQSGADPSGWDLTQLLRVPYTTNFKYPASPRIVLHAASDEPVSILEFEKLEVVEKEIPEDGPDTPDFEALPEYDKIIYKYQPFLDRSFYELHSIEPDASQDWSTRMWKLLNLCLEAGMTPEETFAVSLSAKCNKYVRDRRPLRYLWREVLKANTVQKKMVAVAGTFVPLVMPEIVTPEEWDNDHFIARYRDWASNSSDAVPTYHDLAAAILLSATLAQFVRVDLSYDTLIPNIWGLVLGESTLTRKTTAMSMAVKIMQEVDSDTVLATDGSAEGLLTGLGTRPGKVSVFYKDEVTGFIESIVKKDYLAGMAETLTQLYDVPPIYRRILRKEEITISRPVFIFFGGGIRDKFYSLLNDTHVLSGFLPRFLVVNGNTDLSRLRRTGPRTSDNLQERQKIVNHLTDLHDAYSPQGQIRLPGGAVIDLAEGIDQAPVEAVLTEEAWLRYGEIEEKMVSAAYDNYYSTLALPTFERLSRSLLKLAVLLAAERQKPIDGRIEVSLRDLLNSARYIQDWGRHSVELILNVGKTQSFRTMEKVRQTIERNPGILRSDLMKRHHLNSRDLTDIILNLIERGEIVKKSKTNRAEQYWITT